MICGWNVIHLSLEGIVVNRMLMSLVLFYTEPSFGSLACEHSEKTKLTPFVGFRCCKSKPEICLTSLGKGILLAIIIRQV